MIQTQKQEHFDTNMSHNFGSLHTKSGIQSAETCLLVDEHEFLVRAIAHFLLEVDQFLNSLVSKSTFCLHKFLSFGSTLVEKPGIDFAVVSHSKTSYKYSIKHTKMFLMQPLSR